MPPEPAADTDPVIALIRLRRRQLAEWRAMPEDHPRRGDMAAATWVVSELALGHVRPTTMAGGIVGLHHALARLGDTSPPGYPIQLAWNALAVVEGQRASPPGPPPGP